MWPPMTNLLEGQILPRNPQSVLLVRCFQWYRSIATHLVQFRHRSANHLKTHFVEQAGL